MTSSSDKSFRLEELMPLIREQLDAGKTVSFSPRGTSMLPMLRQGKDTVELSPLPEHLRKYDLPLYRRANGQYVLHRIVKAGESCTCIGDNQFEYERGVDYSCMIAIVTAFTRDGKRIEVSDPGYRAYCRFWVATRGLRHCLMRLRHLPGRIKRRLF